jgi:hypothetical protein
VPRHDATQGSRGMYNFVPTHKFLDSYLGVSCHRCRDRSERVVL